MSNQIRLHLLAPTVLKLKRTKYGNTYTGLVTITTQEKNHNCPIVMYSVYIVCTWMIKVELPLKGLCVLFLCEGAVKRVLVDDDHLSLFVINIILAKLLHYFGTY